MSSTDGRTESPIPSLRGVFDRVSTDARVRVNAQEPVYSIGDADDAVYLIESGQVKLSMSSAEGKDCLLAIYTAGEVFGESCFDGTARRLESAVAMQPTLVRRASRREFLMEMERASAYESLLRHLAVRLADRQAAVFDLVTTASERRLAKTLLAFAEKLGRVEGTHLRLDRISHEELSQFIGTTRPRITAFMQRFRKAGLIKTSGRTIHVNPQRIRDFLARD
jgi:CRP/FNR family cyclic AMP-dependent transcriptional regulator